MCAVVYREDLRTYQNLNDYSDFICPCCHHKIDYFDDLALEGHDGKYSFKKCIERQLDWDYEDREYDLRCPYCEAEMEIVIEIEDGLPYDDCHDCAGREHGCCNNCGLDDGPDIICRVIGIQTDRPMVSRKDKKLI